MSSYRRANLRGNLSSSGKGRTCSKCFKIAQPSHAFCMDCGSPFPADTESSSSSVVRNSSYGSGNNSSGARSYGTSNATVSVSSSSYRSPSTGRSYGSARTETVSSGSGTVCPKCGKEGKPNYKFCDKDGTRLEEAGGSSYTSSTPSTPTRSTGNQTTTPTRSTRSYSTATTPSYTRNTTHNTETPSNSTSTPNAPVRSTNARRYSRGNVSSPVTSTTTTSSGELKCPKCGKPGKPNYKFCDKDGTRLEAASSETSVSTPIEQNTPVITPKESEPVVTPSRRSRSISRQPLVSEKETEPSPSRYTRSSQDSTNTSTSRYVRGSSKERESVTPVITNRYRRNSIDVKATEDSRTSIPVRNRYRRSTSKDEETETPQKRVTTESTTPERCSTCSSKLKPNARFCESCGGKVEPLPVVAAPIREEPEPVPEPTVVEKKDLPATRVVEESSDDSSDLNPKKIVSRRRKLERKVTNLLEDNKKEEEDLKRKELERRKKLEELESEIGRDNFVASTIQKRKMNRTETLKERRRQAIDSKTKKMGDYWGTVFNENEVDENLKSDLIELSYTLGVVNDQNVDEQDLPENFIKTSEGYAPEAPKFMEQMKEALEINLKAMGIEEEELKNTVDTHKSLIDKVQALESKLKDVKGRDSEHHEQERIYQELQNSIEAKFESFEKQMQDTQDKLNQERTRAENTQKNEEEIQRLESFISKLEQKMNEQIEEMQQLQDEREQRKLDEMAERMTQEREAERQAEIARLKSKLKEDEERRNENDKKLYQTLMKMENRLKDTETALQEEKRSGETVSDSATKSEMEKYFREMEVRFQEQEERKARELQEQQEKIARLEAALSATQTQLEMEKMNKPEMPQINLDGANVMDSIEELMLKMMGSKMASFENKLKSLESRAISGDGPVRDFESIQKEMQELQEILFDPDTPEQEIKRVNIEFEKLMAEYERTPEYQEQQAAERRAWKDENEPLNNQALMEVKSKLLALQSTNRDKYVQKIRDNPILKIIVLDKEAIMKKHQNDWKSIVLGECSLKVLRALYAALPDFRNDQTVQRAIVENLKLKIDDLVANPKPKRKKRKKVVHAGGIPPPPPPSAPVIKVAKGPSNNEEPGDMFAELLKRRKRIE